MFEAENRDSIQQRMIDSYSGKLSTVEGSFTRDNINTNSVEFEKTSVTISLMMDAAYADSAWGVYLEKRCAEHGIMRNKAVKARGNVMFEGVAGTNIPAGTVVRNADGVSYVTLNDVVITASRTAIVEVEAEEAGLKGDTIANTITIIPFSVSGVESVNNPEPITGGYDEETDEELFKRFDFAVKNPHTTGNVNDYIFWATSVDGVGAVRVKELWNGPGTVKVLILGSDGRAASNELIQNVADYIESVRVLGADVTVAGPEAVNVKVSIYGLVGSLDVDEFKRSINNYITNRGFDMQYLSDIQTGAHVMKQSTVIDFSYIRLNGERKLTVTDDEALFVQEVELLNADPD